MKKEIESSILIKVLIVQCLSAFCVAQDFDFFYFVQQWPGSYCDTSQSCCHPSTGKPAADFGIHGLWPTNTDGSYPSNCDPGNPFDQSKVSDLMSRLQENWPSLACPSSSGTTFWSHEWDKHGTCSESILDQHSYFKSALDIKDNLNILQILQSSGTFLNKIATPNTTRFYLLTKVCGKHTIAIQPDGGTYSLSSIKDAIRSAVGSTPWIQCNVDESGNSQLYQIYICVNSSGLNTIECPVMPSGKCSSGVEFPSF